MLSTASVRDVAARAAKGKVVVIAGAGPVGLTLSALLSRYGVCNLVVEKSAGLPNHPQAHFINCRTMEIFRHAFPPTLAQHLEECVPAQRYWRHFLYATSVLRGVEIGRVDHFPPPGAVDGAPHVLMAEESPTTVAHLSQKRLMPLLFEEAEAARTPQGSNVMFGWEVQGYHEVPTGGNIDGVQVTVTDKHSGQRNVLDCQYLVAADGASSRLRQLARIEMQGSAGIQHLINIHFSSRELARATKERPAMLYFLYNKAVICVLVAHHFESGEFVAQLPYFPPVQSPADFDPDSVKPLLDAAVGQSLPDLTVHSVRPWTMDCQVARHYRSGRLFLAGDAAHRFPPAGGFGMNTGIQDAHNLAWKLALVMHGQADDRLLDLYEPERHPVAQHNADLSMRNFERSLRVPRALGLDVDQAKVLAQSSTAGLLPKAVFESMLALGRRPLQALEEPGQLYGTTCLSKARQVLRDGAGLPLLFPHDDLGYCYRDATHITEQKDKAEKHLGALVHGGRLPHVWLECIHPETGTSLGTISTTDLADQLHVAAVLSLSPSASPPLPFALLLTGPGAHSMTLGPASRVCWPGGEMPVRQVEIVAAGGGNLHDSSMVIQKSTTTTFARLAQGDRQVLTQHLIETGRLQLLDAQGNWRKKIAGDSSWAVLLRPDGHVWQIFGSEGSGRSLAEAFEPTREEVWLVK